MITFTPKRFAALIAASLAAVTLIGCGTALAGNDSYDRGYDAGQGLALQFYHAGASQTAACREALLADYVDQEMEDKRVEVSQQDYFQGCYDALGDA